MAKIVHLIDSLQMGGAQTHLVTMLRHSVGTHCGEHEVISLFGDGPIGDQLRDLGIPLTVLDLRGEVATRRFRQATRSIGAHLRELSPDIVEAHLTYSRLVGLYAAWRTGVPVRIGFEQGDIYLTSWRFRLANFVGQLFAHRIIVCSQALADWNHRTHRISRTRMVVLHNCVDADRFDPTTVESAAQPFERPAVRTLFCSVGTLGSGVNKRVDVTIRAIARCRCQRADVGLVIAGDGTERSALEALARDLGVEEYVLFLGMRSDLPAILGASDAFCHAAEWEPFGIVCIEAMAMELPVVVPDSGGIHEAVDQGVTGYIYPALDHEELATRMTRLDADPGLREVMGRKGRSVVEARFTVKAYMARLHELYSRMQKERGG